MLSLYAYIHHLEDCKDFAFLAYKKEHPFGYSFYFEN